MTARRARARRGGAGFTLLEVMLALAIMAVSLTMVISGAVDNIHQARRAKALGVVTNLARGKMYDIEELLLQDGFQELDQSDDGDFSDEGYPNIKWEATVDKVELPGLGQLQQAGGEGEDGEGGGGAGGLLGGQDSGFTDPATAAGAGFIGSQFEIIANVLEMSIRRVELKVTWKVGRDDEELVVVCYFTDPAGVAAGIAGGSGDDDGSDDGGAAGGGGGAGGAGGAGGGAAGGGGRSGSGGGK